jgi:hypothetical protein
LPTGGSVQNSHEPIATTDEIQRLSGDFSGRHEFETQPAPDERPRAAPTVIGSAARRVASFGGVRRLNLKFEFERPI